MSPALGLISFQHCLIQRFQSGSVMRVEQGKMTVALVPGAKILHVADPVLTKFGRHFYVHSYRD